MKAQVYGQALVYIFTLVLVSIILVYGYNAIVNFRGRASQVSFLKFKNGLTNSMEEMASQYESLKEKAFSLPEGIKKVCFVETYDALDITAIGASTSVDAILKDSVQTETQPNPGNLIKIKNIFLIDDTVKNSFNVPVKMMVANDPVDDVYCLDAVGGRITVKIKGKGDGVEIS